MRVHLAVLCTIYRRDGKTPSQSLVRHLTWRRSATTSTPQVSWPTTLIPSTRHWLFAFRAISKGVIDSEWLDVVTLVAHSMGGLVSRACLGLTECRDDVIALYTLGSPHAGINSVFLLKLLARLRVPVAEQAGCSWQPALCQFSTDRMVWFNLFHPNRGGVSYSFIGGTKTPFPMGWLLLPFHGPNDGVVGSYSAAGWLYRAELNILRGPPGGCCCTGETH